ncbi:MAG: hypothetical protein C0448_00780 [Sphingobacteriaceae bacterium]|nr:hypothetical protein [Sphingobacteriaceae bacterium]
MTNAIGIVGGGISGTLSVLQIIKQSKKPLSIYWFDTQNKFCKGYAYNTFDEGHLLNVRASNMSVFPDEPHHFVNWLNIHHPKYSPKDFVPRKLFGDYVLHTFELLKKSNALITIHQIAEEVKSIKKIGDCFEMNTHQNYQVQKIILGFGNFLPAHPRSVSKEFISSKNYFQNAFNVQLTNQIQLHNNITIIGSGLTMIDVIVSLSHFNYKGKINVISPHAYIPQAHQENPLPSVEPFVNQNQAYTLLEILSLVNKQLKKAKKENLNLHSVVDSMRPFLQNLWLNFSIEEKKQFLRHLRHKWGVARHRAPSQSMAIFNTLKSSNQLQLIKGRISDIKLQTFGFEIFYSNNQTEQQTLHTQLIINCTGPESDYSQLKSPLIQDLINNQIISHDSIKYGINAQKDGYITNNIYTIGPPLKGILWESVAVPEIRVQAQELAPKIICD